ncbi:cysteine hydrolase family protein [Pelagibius sp.]|uniref:cysteine hydrolase family protein n=1 Tax=Pelagibius sp. TaxID=1931238 RepID=UPI003BB07B80
MSDETSKQTVLMIIDFQKAIDDPKWGRQNNPDAERQATDLLKAWRRHRRPVIHVQHLSTEADSPYRPGQAGCDFKEDLAPCAGEIVIQKHTNNAFIETGLEAALRDRKITDLVIAGVLLHNSVDATVRMAANLGFRVRLVEDATKSCDLRDPSGRVWPAEDVHAVSLAQLGGEYAQIDRTRSLLAALPTLVADPSAA